MKFVIDNWLAPQIWQMFSLQAAQARGTTILRGGREIPLATETEVLLPELDFLQRFIGDETLTATALIRKLDSETIQPRFQSEESSADFVAVLFLNPPNQQFGGVEFSDGTYFPMRPNRLVVFNVGLDYALAPGVFPKGHQTIVKQYFLRKGGAAPALNLIKGR